MKKIILTILLSTLFNQNYFSQGNYILNRVYANVGLGYKRAFEIDFMIHLMEHFSFSANQVINNEIAAPNTDFLSGNKLLNTYTTYNFMIGVTTNTQQNLDVDFLLGFSKLNGLYHTDITKHSNLYTADNEYYKSKIKQFSSYGISARFDVNYQIRRGVGLNLGIQDVYTDKYNQFSVTIGLCFGFVQCI